MLDTQYELFAGKSKRRVPGFSLEVVDWLPWLRCGLPTLSPGDAFRLANGRGHDDVGEVAKSWNAADRLFDRLLGRKLERCVRGESIGDDLAEQVLIVATRFVAIDVGVAKLDQHGADIRVLELDRAS